MYYGSDVRNFNLINNSIDIDSSDLLVKEVEDGIILPIINSKHGFLGGVIDQKYNFVAGHTQTSENYKTGCFQSWDLNDIQPSDISKSDEKVIFGGVVYTHFGHFISESLSRLWYYCQNIDTTNKIVFIKWPMASKYDYTRLLSILGIDENRYVIIEKPTQFAKIIIPSQSYYIADGKINIKSRDIYQLLIKNSRSLIVNPENVIHSKIYLSRTSFYKNDGINEEYFENFFHERGFSIIHPENFPVEQQILIMANADEVVCTAGTLSLLLFFCKSGTKCTILLRDDLILHSYLHPVKLNDLQAAVVAANYNFLPENHFNANLYLYGPTRYFIEYLKEENITYSDAEVCLEKNLYPYIYNYIVSWANKCTYEKHFFSQILNYDSILSIIDLINIKFLNKHENMVNLQQVLKNNLNMSIEPSVAIFNKFYYRLDILESQELEFNYDYFSNTQKVYVSALSKLIHYEINHYGDKLYIALHFEDAKYSTSIILVDYLNNYIRINDTFRISKSKYRNWIYLEKFVDPLTFRNELTCLIGSTLPFIKSMFEL